MIIHTSEYEKDGWIRLDKSKPPVNKRVRLTNIRMLDWNLEVANWCTVGYMRESGKFSLKACDNLSLKNSNPTHWREIK